MAEQQQPQPQPERTSSLGAADSEFEKLQSLNKMLVQSVSEKRREMEILEEEKKDLAAEVKSLGNASDESICLEIEHKVAFAVLEESGMIEKLAAEVEDERERLSKICTEKDLVRSELDEQIREVGRLKVRVKEMEKIGKDNESETLGLRDEIDALVKQKSDSEKEVERLERIRDSTERSLAEKAEEIEGLKVEINEIEKEKSDQIVKIGFLEKDVQRLNTDLQTLRSLNNDLVEKLVCLEKSYSEAVEKEKAMQMKVDLLIEEQREKNKMIERLTEEKGSLEKMIESVNTEVQTKNGLIQKLSTEKSEIEGITRSKESKIMELQNSVSELSESVAALKDSLKAQEDKNMELGLESKSYRVALDQVRITKDELMKALENENSEGLKLKARLSEMEKRIEEELEKLEKAKSEQKKLSEAKKSLEGAILQLKEESSATQKRLSDAELENGNLASKYNTVATLLPKDDDDNSGNKEQLEELMERMKGSFRDKEAMLEEKGLQVSSLQESIAEAEKKKTVWAMVSSVATMFAAVSLAFAFKVR
ncbi:hypothetical protein LINPERHAP1_LOCUS35365 [Linum perenne]